MNPFTSILCALDSSPLAPRVLRHAIGLAGVYGAKLTVLMVVTGDRHQAEETIAALLKEALPQGASYVEPRVMAVQLVMGEAVDAILTVAGEGVDLIVAGTQSRSGLSRWFLGSTSVTLLEQAVCPTLLVPPGDVDIVELGPSAARLTPGGVLAAVDLADINQRQLHLAGQLATAASQPLTLMTVTSDDTADAAAQLVLGDLAQRVGGTVHPTTIVRHGSVANEIDLAAVDAHAGLVVMGLRSVDRGTPGEIATAVLKRKDALVLAVPAV